MDINQDCQYLKQTTSLVYSHQFYMLHLDHTSMTLQYLVMNIFQTPGSCWIQWWNRVINSSRWKTWSLAPMKFFPTPFPFPPLNVSIKRTLSPCILCYQNDILGTQHLLATKKNEKNIISTTFQSSWCSNPENWATRVACPSWSWRKNGLSILVFSLGSAFQSSKKICETKTQFVFGTLAKNWNQPSSESISRF